MPQKVDLCILLRPETLKFKGERMEGDMIVFSCFPIQALAAERHSFPVFGVMLSLFHRILN